MNGFRNKKLILEFGDPPELVKLEFHPADGSEAIRCPEPGNTLFDFKWTEFPKAVSLFFLAWKLHAQRNPKVPFEFSGKARHNPAATLGDGTESPNTNPLLNFLQTRVGVFFLGRNKSGKNKDRNRSLWLKGINSEFVEIKWKRNGQVSTTNLSDWQELFGKIFERVPEWENDWITEIGFSANHAPRTQSEGVLEKHAAAPHLTPSSEARSWDEKLRKEMIRSNRFIRLVGIRQAADVSNLPLETSFVSLSFDAKARWVRLVKPEAETKPMTIEGVLQQSRRCVIVGRPGSGKSTLARMVGLRLAQGKLAGIAPDLNVDSIPLLIKVRSLYGRFDQLPDPKEIVRLNLPDVSKNYFKSDYAHELFELGRAVLILDGLDECELPSGTVLKTEPCEWVKLMNWLEDLGSQYPNLRIIATSRPVNPEFVSLMAQVGLEHFTVLPFALEQQLHFVENWYAALQSAVTNSMGQSPESQSIQDKKEALQKLLTASNKDLANHCQTPLLLSVVCALHCNGGLDTGKLPQLLHLFFDLLLDEWRRSHQEDQDLKDNVLSKIEKNQLKLVLSEMALEMVRQNIQKLGRKPAIEFLQSRLNRLGLATLTASEILATVRDRSGVLEVDAGGDYQFIHNQFRELMAGHSLARTNALDLLLENAGKSEWLEVIKFAVQEDSLAGSKETIVRALLQNGKYLQVAKVANVCTPLSESLQAEIAQQSYLSFVCTPEERKRYGLREGGMHCLHIFNSAISVAKLYELMASEKVVSVPGLDPTLLAFLGQNTNVFDILPTAQSLAYCCHACHTTASQGPARNGFGIEKAYAMSFCDGKSFPTSMDKLKPTLNHDEIGGLLWQSLSLVKISKTGDIDDLTRFLWWAITLIGTSTDVHPFYCPDKELFLKGFRIFLQNGGTQLLRDNLTPLYRLEDLISIFGKSCPPYLRELFQFFRLVPATSAPAFQIGIINRAVHKHGQYMGDELIKEATGLWWRSVDAIESGAVQKIYSWHNQFGIKRDGQLNKSTADELMNCFKEEFRRELTRLSPSPFAFDKISRENTLVT